MIELAAYVTGSYATAYRTACLIVGDPADAEDAVQEAFLRAWRFRAAVRDETAYEAWLYRVLVNACYSKLRSSSRHRADEPLSDEWPAAGVHGVDPAAAADAAEVRAVVRDALAALPEALRIPLVLRYFVGLSEKDIAAAIRRRPGTVKSRLHEARRRLAADARLAMFAEEVAT